MLFNCELASNSFSRCKELMIFEFCVSSTMCVRGFTDKKCGDGCGNDKKRFSRLDDYFGLPPRVLLPLVPQTLD